MDKGKVFAAIVVAIVVIGGISLAYISSRDEVKVETVIKETIIQPIEYNDHTYLMFIQGTQIKTVVHSEDCNCKE